MVSKSRTMEVTPTSTPVPAQRVSTHADTHTAPQMKSSGVTSLKAMGDYHYATSILQRRAMSPAHTVTEHANPGGNLDPGTVATTARHTGLPDRLRSGIRALSGMDLGNVNVHYNSSRPAQLRALAYAQGNDIHVAPGQERHLPHEAWHVVQQRQRRVTPNLQMKGVALNQDVSLEKEADQMGARAWQAASHESAKAAGMMPTAQSTRGNDSAVVQAKMGFEFQTSNPITQVGGRPFGFKQRLYRGTGFTVEPDGRDMEVITDPFDYWEDMYPVLTAIYHFIRGLRPNARGDDYEFRRGADGWQVDGNLDIQDRNFDAAIQATEGVPLERIGPYLEEHLNRNDEGAGINQRTQPWDRIFGPRALGLLKMIGVYLARANHVPNARDDEDGPKALFRVMARTDFRSMFLSLPDVDQEAFRQFVWNLHYDRLGARAGLASITGNAWNDQVFPNGFYYDGYDAGRTREVGPSTVQWIGSIVYGGAGYGRVSGKDLLSPPLATAPENLAGIDSYGMGREPIDAAVDGTPLPLFEMRGLQSKFGEIAYPEWRNFARRLFFNAIARNTTLRESRRPLHQYRPGRSNYKDASRRTDAQYGRSYRPYGTARRSPIPSRSRSRSRSPVRSSGGGAYRRTQRSRSRSPRRYR